MAKKEKKNAEAKGKTSLFRINQIIEIVSFLYFLFQYFVVFELRQQHSNTAAVEERNSHKCLLFRFHRKCGISTKEHQSCINILLPHMYVCVCPIVLIT